MNEHLTAAMQRRTQALYRYTGALENGDVEMLASVLAEAEHDQVLERMLLEVNEVYTYEDRLSSQAGDMVLAHQVLPSVLPAQNNRIEEMNEHTSNDENETKIAAHHATRQVLPSREIPRSKWYRLPRHWIVAAVAAVLIGLLVLPASQGLADQFLSLFRVQQFHAVKVNPAMFNTHSLISSSSLPQLQDFGTMTVQPNSFQTRGNLSASQAAQIVGFHILQPSNLPAGVSHNAAFDVLDRGQAMFTFSSAKVKAYLARNGQAHVAIPANLDGATFTISVSPGVLMRYANPGGFSPLIAEIPSPIVRATGHASLEQLRDFLLSLPGLPPELVTQLKQIDLNSGTMPLPVPPEVSSQPVTVHGASGVLLASTAGLSSKIPVGSFVIWQEHGIIYAVGGSGINTTQLLATANSLR